MEQKLEFVLLANQGKVSIQSLCLRYGITRKTGYKWLKRFEEKGESGLKDLSRKPRKSPTKTDGLIEQRILEIRASSRGAWGAKKIKKLLENEMLPNGTSITEVPACSTINAILKRNGCVTDKKSQDAKSWIRFEHDCPNDLWQMDFKGHLALLNSKRCHFGNG